MRYIPILFRTDMVQSILRDQKRKTRRIKGLEEFEQKEGVRTRYGGFNAEKNSHVFQMEWKDATAFFYKKCPYGVIGDILWVKETWAQGSIENGKNTGVTYKADNPQKMIKWKPSIFMPKKVCRIFIRITNVYAEPLKFITDDEALKEGVNYRLADSHDCYDELKGGMLFENYIEKGMMQISATESFQTLWDSINGDGSFHKNPWVWVIEFEKTNKPENFG